VHFPARYGGAESEAMVYYQQQIKRVLALCDFVLTGQGQHLEALAALDEWLLDQNPPQIHDEGDPRNVLVLGRQRFGKACAALAEQGYPNAALLSLFDFNCAIDHLLKKATGE
jgi:hypothetical protein